MARPDQEAIDTFFSITGDSEAAAVQTIELQGSIAKDIYSGVLSSTSTEDARSNSVQAHSDMDNSDANDLWYNDTTSCENSVENLNNPSDMDREWQRRHDQFHTIGYRDGLIAGKETSAQEGFNIGFKESVFPGYNWGLVRGITSAMAFLPDGLMEKLVQTKERRHKFQCLHESVHSLSTTDALKLFHEQLSKSAQNDNDEHSPNAGNSNSKIPEVGVLQNYSEELQSLINEEPLLNASLKVNEGTRSSF